MNMNKWFLSIGFVAVCVRSAVAADASTIQARYQSYYDAGKAVVISVINKSVDVRDVARKVDTMVRNGVVLAKEYAVAFPEGAQLLDEVVRNVDAMRTLSFEELEHDWHDLHHFDTRDAGIDLTEEDNEHFTDPIHVIVHPLLVLKAAENFAAQKNADELQTMKEEIEEGLEQAERLKGAVIKKRAAK